MTASLLMHLIHNLKKTQEAAFKLNPCQGVLRRAFSVLAWTILMWYRWGSYHEAGRGQSKWFRLPEQVIWNFLSPTTCLRGNTKYTQRIVFTKVHDVEFSHSLEQVVKHTLPALALLKAQGKVRWVPLKQKLLLSDRPSSGGDPAGDWASNSL